MSRFVFSSALVLAGFFVAAVANAQNTTAAAPAPAVSARANAQVSVKPENRHCLRNTGSAAPAKPGQCLPVTGRSYSQQDLENTGDQRIGPALRKLDPSITTGH